LFSADLSIFYLHNDRNYSDLYNNLSYHKPMRILLTGASGFLGSHLSERLTREGHLVIGLDNLHTGSIDNLRNLSNSPNFKFVQGSILDSSLLRSLASESDYVFHLAAAVGVFNIVNKPLESLLINIRGTENVLEVAKEYDLPLFFTSSSEVYGKNSSDSLSESDDRILGSPTTLRWSYSEAKAIDESLVHAYYTEKKLESRIVRFFNTVGPRQLGSYGMVVPRFVKSALENTPITIYGSGEQTRCFAHVYDVIDAVMAVAFSEKTVGKVLNIGNNQEISMNDLANLIISETNSTSSIIHIPYEEAYGSGFEDMQRRVPNINLIKSLVGWEPQRSLETIIEDIVAEMTNKITSQ
jgi:UDP-glucose 4-epimerase